MKSGIIIEVKVIVEWPSCIVNQTCIVKSEWYYVPDLKSLLISPQRFFRRSTSITGEFICNEYHAQLRFWVHLVLKIDYDSKDNFTTATSCNYVIDSPSINLCITDDTNKYLSPAAKRLLEWKFWFGHQNIRDTQIILRSPPLGTDKFLLSSHIPF